MEKMKTAYQTIADLAFQLQRIETKLDQFMSNEYGWCDAQDVCNKFNISKRTLIYYREQGLLPFAKIGGKIFYRSKEIDQCLTRSMTNLNQKAGQMTKSHALA